MYKPDRIVYSSYMFKEQLGRAVRAARDSVELTVEEFAPLVGVSEHSVRSWESGRRSPSDRYKAKICGVCDGDFIMTADGWGWRARGGAARDHRGNHAPGTILAWQNLANGYGWRVDEDAGYALFGYPACGVHVIVLQWNNEAMEERCLRVANAVEYHRYQPARDGC